MHCPGCHKTIDPMFDSAVKDARGVEWHAGCMVQQVGAHDTVAMADGERAMRGSLLGWILGWLDRRPVRKVR